ncbi:MAG: AAA family ATPase [Halobacteria archaeon]
MGDEPQLLVGDPGTGKTSTAWIASDELGYPLNQTNVSDARTGDDIERMAKSMSTSPADAEHQLVLLDEVDSWHHAVNKQPLYQELDNPKNPIILTANEKHNIPDGIKNKCNIEKFRLQKRSRRAKIREIAEREDLDLDDQDLETLSERPDLRSAINDLQNWAETDLPPGQDQREWERSPFEAITDLMKCDGEWTDAFRPPEMVLWADENLSTEWRGLEAGIAYDCLSRADRWLGRAQRRNYRYWKYASALCERLPETRLTEPYDGYINVDFPQWFQSREESYDDSSGEAELFRALKKERGYRMAGSYYEFRQSILPVLCSLNEEERKSLALNYSLSKDAVEALELDVDDFEDWRDMEEPEAGDGWQPDINSADW